LSETTNMTRFAEIDCRIKKTFQVLDDVAQGVVTGHIRSVIVSGAPGVGKSHNLETKLSYAESAGKIRYNSMKGSVSPIGVYKTLFESSTENSVLLLDDIDSVFGDIESLNLLKGALDSGGSRRIHWAKESRALENDGIPRSFEFNGSVFFVTNIDFTTEIAKDNKLSPHYRAVIDRSLYLDLGIHTKEEVLARIIQVCLSDEFMDKNRLTLQEAADIIAWVTINVNRLRTLSIRTMLQLASLIKTNRNWQEMAEVVMLKR